MSRFKMLQITNNNIGAIVENSFLPLGTITRRVDCSNNMSAFTVSSSGTDTITINEAGYYEIEYSISEIATNAGISSVTLVVNGADLYTVGVTATAGGTINLTLPYTVRVFNRCDNMATNNPMTIQFRTDTEITSATSNVIVKRVY